MTSDRSPLAAALPAAAPVRDKVRIRFTKGNDLRLLSHHDLMRTFERMLRRADLPFRRSQGFNPRPRLVFALSLPLGVVGVEEVVELELGQELPVEEIEERLRRQAPPGLGIVSVRRIDPKASAQVQGLSYAVDVPAERVVGPASRRSSSPQTGETPVPPAGDLRARIAEVLAAAECWWERARPPKRRIDLRPWIRALHLNETTAQPPRPYTLTMDLRLTPTGTARPEEVLGLLGLADLLDAGAVCTRARLELQDELPSSHAEGIR
jgi:radical SAM-linked protein